MKDGKDYIDLLARGRNSIEYGSGKKPKKGTQSRWLIRRKKKKKAVSLEEVK